MSTLTFVGAAGTVSGSKHLISLDGRALFVDCGLYQGPREIEALNGERLPVRPFDVEAVVLTHGHLDHVGFLPKLVRDGFHGRIYCTPATADVAAIVLEDAAGVQRHLRERGFHHERAHGMSLLYEEADVQATLQRFHEVAFETAFEACGARMRYHEAGHIIGAAFVDIETGGKRLVFSGDVGRYDRMMLRDPAPIGAADIVVCEATYGDRLHARDPLGALEAVLLEAIARGGPIVIPAFAVERSQELLFATGVLQQRNAEIARLPVHLDSPMAIRVDRLFARHPEAHKPLADPVAFGCANLTLHVTGEESKLLNQLAEPAIIVASSGMATGGRVLHHLHRLLPNPTATIAFVGYQVVGTLGRTLVDGAPRVRIFGDELPVRARVAHVGGFSAHADQSELLRWLGTATTQPHVHIVHADPPAAAAFATIVTQRLGLVAEVARRGDVVTI